MFVYVLLTLGLLFGHLGVHVNGTQTTEQNRRYICAVRNDEERPCITMGRNFCGDRLFLDVDRDKGWWPLIKRTEYYTYPPDFQTPDFDYINRIWVTNKMPSGEEGTVKVTSGGVGFQNVTFYLESQRGEGYHFNIKIWGTRRGARCPDRPVQYPRQGQVHFNQIISPRKYQEEVVVKGPTKIIEIEEPVKTIPAPVVLPQPVKVIPEPVYNPEPVKVIQEPVKVIQEPVKYEEQSFDYPLKN